MKNSNFETVIGLEIHIQLDTNSKIFCGDANIFGGTSNDHTSVISLAHPGTLPRINKTVVAHAIKLASAIGSAIQTKNHFDRKHYFYPDLPKAYQLTQDRIPFCTGGRIRFKSNGKYLTIGIHHIHMEEDAGKSLHHLDPNFSFIDLNRAGVPLLEIVTHPDLRSGQEVHDFLDYLQQLVRYLNISNANMEEGSMRCDCNVSVRKEGTQTLGERCEIKNLNSKKFARKAIEYEAKRQVKEIHQGGIIRRETLHFDPETGLTSPMREKEGAHDYRYFPDPDLPPVVLTQEFIDRIKRDLPLLPDQWEQKLMGDYGLTQYQSELLSRDLQTVEYFIEFAAQYQVFKSIANLVINKILPYIHEKQISINQFPVTIAHCSQFLEFVDQNKIPSSSAYRSLFPAMLNDPGSNVGDLARELNLIVMDEEDIYLQIVDDLIDKYPNEVVRYKGGKKALIGFFIGQALRNAGASIKPDVLREKLQTRLDEPE